LTLHSGDLTPRTRDFSTRAADLKFAEATLKLTLATKHFTADDFTLTLVIFHPLCGQLQGLAGLSSRGAETKCSPGGASPGLSFETIGYSTGKWDGDTLVVDTKGFNGKAWIDQLGNRRMLSM
jgi:hypothetical protein